MQKTESQEVINSETLQKSPLKMVTKKKSKKEKATKKSKEDTQNSTTTKESKNVKSASKKKKKTRARGKRKRAPSRKSVLKESKENAKSKDEDIHVNEEPKGEAKELIAVKENQDSKISESLQNTSPKSSNKNIKNGIENDKEIIEDPKQSDAKTSPILNKKINPVPDKSPKITKFFNPEIKKKNKKTHNSIKNELSEDLEKKERTLDTTPQNNQKIEIEETVPLKVIEKISKNEKKNEEINKPIKIEIPEKDECSSQIGLRDEPIVIEEQIKNPTDIKLNAVENKLKSTEIKPEQENKIEKEDTEIKEITGHTDKKTEEELEESDADDGLDKRSISLSKSKEAHAKSEIEFQTEQNESANKLKDFKWKYYPTKDCSMINYVTGNYRVLFSL
jgi:hypothetical protein